MTPSTRTVGDLLLARGAAPLWLSRLPRLSRTCWLALPLLAGLAGCGGGVQVCGVAGAGPCPEVVQLTHLPELTRFVEFGETRPEDVQGRFRGEHLHVTSSSLANLRTLVGGPNEGRRYATVDVVRRLEAGAPVGELGDEFTLRFEFTAQSLLKLGETGIAKLLHHTGDGGGRDA